MPCARLHARQLLWEWSLTALSDSDGTAGFRTCDKRYRSPASSAGEGEGWASAGTTTMIDDQGHKIKSGIPPRTPGKLS
jgi:hypothetical protein